MEKPKSLSERLKAIRLKDTKCKEKSSSNCGMVNTEDYPKLRKPKPATLLKIQTRQNKADNIEEVQINNKKDDVQVPLRQEFLTKKQQLEQATSNLLKKYEQRKILEDDTLSWDSEEAQPLTLHTKLEAYYEDLKLKHLKSAKQLVVKEKPLNYIEQHLVGILFTKVEAHPSGFFAENLPAWYKKTFDKDISDNWFELIKRSKEFYIEEVQNKVLLYAKERNKNPVEEIDIKASGDKIIEEKQLAKSNESNNVPTETSIGFVRYKHLQKSLKDYTKQQSAGREQKKGLKPSEPIKKAAVSKKCCVVKK